MNTHHTYTTKAEKYARYRWDYAPEAIAEIFNAAQLDGASTVADIGAGTGILTAHFAGRVGKVYAIEPNTEMRREAARRLTAAINLPMGADCVVLGGSAEQIPLRDHSVDMISVAQAIHWCEPEATRREFLRVLRPGGWLALVRNFSVPYNFPAHDAGDNFDAAMAQACTAENGVSEAKASPPAYKRPPDFYFGGAHYLKFEYPFSYQQDWDTFIGSLCSASYMPDEHHPAYPRFEKAVRAVFERFSQDGLLPGCGVTELVIGKVME